MGNNIKLMEFKSALLRNPTMSPTKIAFAVYDCKSMKSAACVASNAIRKLGIQLKDLMERAGLDDEHDIEYLKKLLKAKKDDEADYTTRKAAFEIEQKLKGRLKDRKEEGNSNVVVVSMPCVYVGERKMEFDVVDKPNTVDAAREIMNLDDGEVENGGPLEDFLDVDFKENEELTEKE